MTKRVLVVDDDPWIRQLIRTMLSHSDYDCDEAENGKQGLAKALSYHPDLIISDILMDTMDGWTFIRQLRSRSEFNLVPVIFLTALDSEEDRIKGFHVGADDYLVKPFHHDEFQARIEKAFKSIDRMRDYVEKVAAYENPTLALKGSLKELGLSSLLTLFELEKKTGILILKTVEPSSEGRIFFRKGNILDAMVTGHETEQGAFAIYTMLQWSSGQFEFLAVDVDMKKKINESTTNLLMNGAQLIDERAEAERRKNEKKNAQKISAEK